LSLIHTFREKYKNNRKDWAIFGSNGFRIRFWIIGGPQAKRYCLKNNLEYRTIKNIAYSQCLEELAKSQGLVFLPRAEDTCPRLVIEAKLLGCELILNDLVQHKDEPWFNKPVPEIEQYLSSRANFFWEEIQNILAKAELNPQKHSLSQTVKKL
jgi:hypothetical protein